MLALMASLMKKTCRNLEAHVQSTHDRWRLLDSKKESNAKHMFSFHA